MPRIHYALASTVGEHLKEDFMAEFAIKVPTLPRKLGVPRARVVRLLEGAACGGDMALRLARVFGTTLEFWLNLQMPRDLSLAQVERGKIVEAETTPLVA